MAWSEHSTRSARRRLAGEAMGAALAGSCVLFALVAAFAEVASIATPGSDVDEGAPGVHRPNGDGAAEGVDTGDLARARLIA